MQIIINIIAAAFYTFVLFYVFIFAQAFFVGGISAGSQEPTCKEQNYNIEKLWPVEHACWFWKDVNAN